GFQDAHVHPVGAGLQMLACELRGGGDAAGYLRRVAEYAAANPDLPWITGGGWSMDAFPGGVPSRQALDAVVSDRPVSLVNRGAPGAGVNPRALDLAGVTRDTPDPADGRIEREADGRTPQGTLHEGASTLVGRLVPEPGPDDIAQAMLTAQRHLHS